MMVYTSCPDVRHVFGYSSHGLPLEGVLEYNHSAIIVATNCSRSKHIDHTCSKALMRIAHLRFTLAQASREVQMVMYKSLICPLLNDACVI